MKNARRKLEIPMPAAMHCKTPTNCSGETCRSIGKSKTKYATPKLSLHGLMTWKVMQRNAWKDVANWRIKQLNYYTKSRRHVWITTNLKKKKLESVGELSTVCSQIVLKCLYLARVGRPDILWSVNKLARSITKWTKACDKRLARLISCIHHTCEYRQYCYVGKTAQQCRLGLFQDSDFAGDLEDSKSTSCGLLCIFGSHTSVGKNTIKHAETDSNHAHQSQSDQY